MLDFHKLTDPAEMEKTRLQREAEAQAQAQRTEHVRKLLTLCRDNRSSLSDREARFLRGLTAAYLVTDAQLKWLADIAARFQ